MIKALEKSPKNLLLINFRKKEETLSKDKIIASACEEYYKIKDKLPLNKQQLGLYSSTAEFVDYILKGTGIKPGCRIKSKYRG